MNARETSASIEQRLLWYMDHYRGKDGVLNCPVIFRFQGALDPSALAVALEQLVDRHESLRTTFTGRGRAVTRIIHAPRPVEMTAVDLRRAADPEAAAQDAIATELRTRIDPTVWPMRATLWRVADDVHLLCVTLHHLVADGWSCGLIFRDVRLLYERACGGADVLPVVGWQYSEYVRWQQAQVANDELRPHQEYWQQQLEGTRLPRLPVRAADQAARLTAKEAIGMDADVCAALRQIARTRRTTLFNVMLSLYYTLLQRLTGESDLAVASLFANRLRAELRETVGALANMVILRTHLPRRATFGDVVHETHATVVGAFLHQSVPFQMLPGLAIQSDSFRADDVVFHMAAEPLAESTMGAVHVRALQVEGVGNRFGLELAVLPQATGLMTILSYDRARVDQEWAREFISQYAALAAHAARTPDCRIDALGH